MNILVLIINHNNKKSPFNHSHTSPSCISPSQRQIQQENIGQRAHSRKLIYSAIKTELNSLQLGSYWNLIFFQYRFTSSCVRAFIYLLASILNISSHNIRSLIYFRFVSIRKRWMNAAARKKYENCLQFELKFADEKMNKH
jgi:hypothetical protein